MATKKNAPKKDLPAHFYDAAHKLREAGKFNVGTKVFKSNPRHQKG